MKTILVGTDGTEHAQRALDRAAELGKAFDARVVITSVAPVLVGSPHGMGGYDPIDTPAEHDRILEEARQHLANAGLTVETALGVGDPANAIIETADGVGADLIVLGTSERSLLERAIGLSVSGAVTRKAHCDVLVVRS